MKACSAQACDVMVSGLNGDKQSKKTSCFDDLIYSISNLQIDSTNIDKTIIQKECPSIRIVNHPFEMIDVKSSIPSKCHPMSLGQARDYCTACLNFVQHWIP